LPQSPPPCLSTDPPPTEIYTLSLHDALPICDSSEWDASAAAWARSTRLSSAGVEASSAADCATAATAATDCSATDAVTRERYSRSEEHTSELQSRENLVCRLLLEKKKKQTHK